MNDAPVGYAEYNPELDIDTSYPEDYKMPIISIPYRPDPRWHPECYDWKMRLKEGVKKKKGEPIYADEYEYMYCELKDNWEEILKRKYRK